MRHTLSFLPRVCIIMALLASAPSLFCAEDSRSAFLRLLDRPRVPLAPELGEPVTQNGVSRVSFSFSADAKERVPGVLLKSATERGASQSTRWPVIISLHGTGGTKESQIPLLTELVRDGFIGVAIDGRYHGARNKTGAGSTEYEDAILRAFRAAPSGTSEHPFFFDTAWDVMRLIDYLVTRDDVDPARIGLIGFSKGGIETYLVAAADPRVAVAIPCIGMESFRWALDHNEAWRSRIETIQSAFDAAAKESGVTHPDTAFVRTFYDRVAPGIYSEFDGPAMIGLIAPRPLLTINGEIDARTPLPGLAECADAARAAYKAAGAEDKFVQHIQAKTGHAVTPASLKLARAWFTYWLKP